MNDEFKVKQIVTNIRVSDVFVSCMVLTSFYHAWYGRYHRATYLLLLATAILVVKLAVALGYILLSLRASAMHAATGILGEVFENLTANQEDSDDDRPGMYL